MIVPLVLAAFFGATMKLADLFNEHGMYWFYGDAIFFGVLWGLFGAGLVFIDVNVANIIFAMILAFLVRLRLDYRNHAIAATIIILIFLAYGSFDSMLFGIFFVVFTLFGGLRDYLGDKRQKNDWWYKINEPAWYYVLPPLIYCFVFGNWIIFAVTTVYIISYDLVKYSLFKLGMYNKL